MTELAWVKKQLREEMIQLRAGISPERRSLQSAEAVRTCEMQVLAPLRERLEASGQRLTVCTYVSFRDEPDTWPLILGCLQRGDRLLVPKIGSQRSLTLHEITGPEDLAPGTWGILEPTAEIPAYPVRGWADIDVAMIPGLAYDLRGGRIGFGGGYYDRFVEKLQALGQHEGKEPILAALAFEEQMIERVPMEDHDFQLDLVIMASRVIDINKGSE
ncbi:5-formyltetrahydrofolate cyclo-ligase [Paenibacillus sp. CAA11]|uniref:5-formyltetrahydrofolate cyclo-ligase n=1 Tax=Paenibacillus sp. CAA11 TaxID=1532905 RepID=UPI000D37D8A1|nr:5-formyltetrahydrofolate cyclo-ligase [Paenibacillus sp. CAA11]AWB46821.1 5-formyltetrahydrofolate cyclo-ligase [Paenibacillus sp. CAA11]